MRTKYPYIVLLAWLMLGVACRDADKEMYSDDTVGLYFKLANLSDDSTLVVNRSAQSVTYTFVYDDADVTEREICIPVQVFGDSAAYNRKYRIEVSPAANTMEGEDYAAIAAEQSFPAGKTIDSLRVVWKRSAAMKDEAKRLDIRIVPDGDFAMGMQEYTSVSLVASEIYECPEWWVSDGDGGNNWTPALGAYHWIKMREWNKLWGRTPLKKNPGSISFLLYPQECVAITKLKELFERETFVDEQGNRLTIPGV